ncbi:MAG: hypothetical protein KJ749_03175 [Planctomycetes bacterium]|nr:hypothetical protein [Planctomycetota bacterium]
MSDHRYYALVLTASVVAYGAMGAVWSGSADHSGNGYVGLEDYAALEDCLAASGPGVVLASMDCLGFFDSNDDCDVDLDDFATFQQAMGHLPMPLKDNLGEIITLNSTRPYSGRYTCGGCHNAEVVTNGFLFQQGRTDTNGEFIMKDDYYDDGRWWTKSSGRYCKWGQTFKYLLAAKDNTSESEMEQTAFAWIRDCGSCHPGGGPGEFDRDGQPFYNEATGQFGYEVLGKTAEDVALDGDYSVLDYVTGAATLAPWDVTGLSGPDCLRCHRTERTVIDGVDMNFVWRKNTLATAEALVDDLGRPVPAFAAASTAGQGWFSRMEFATSSPGRQANGSYNAADAAFLEDREENVETGASSPTLQIDYAVGIANGSLLADQNGALFLSPASVTWPPKDQACWACHPYGTITGTVWFDDSNVMYRKFNNLGDDDPTNDIPPEESRACTVCHIGDLHHNFGRGNSFQIQYRNDLDWNTLRDCRSCHLTQLPNGEPNPGKHPDAPDVPGGAIIHIAEPFEVMACQSCHIPYSLAPAVLFRDITIPDAVGTTAQYYSADPLNPADPDKSRWYPALKWKKDVDGVERLFPVNIWIIIYWGDWHQNGTPDDLSDDIVSPIYTWRVNQVIPEPLPIVTDDNGDGQLEINRPEEILAYIQALKGNDSHGQPVATNPVLVRGQRVWYEDPEAPEGVSYFEPEGTGIPMTWWPYLWGKDHNVRPKEEAWGYAPEFPPSAGCRDCHRPWTFVSPVFDRKILIDPYGPDGQPVYTTVREMTGMNPP